jgi:sulfite dehydrogenase
MNRRQIVKAAAGMLALAEGTSSMPPLVRGAQLALPSGTLAEQVLEALPGKVPLIKKTYRPPNYETPIRFFTETYTPNNAFFVRYHLADIPEVDAVAWRLRIGGPGAERQVELALDDLKSAYEKVEIAAVCQCSGNRRGFSDPHVAGVEWATALLAMQNGVECASRLCSTRWG